MNIAIDGPAGAGKSTIAKLLAQKLNFLYLDTGAMYRAVGLKIIGAKMNLADETEIARILNETEINVLYENGNQKIVLDGEDVSVAIREHNVSKWASDVSALKCVRLKMVEMQRVIAKKTHVILDGRDIGTFVLPNAEYKFFLTASIATRAKRRFDELIKKGAQCNLDDIEKDIVQRDYNDAHREFAPLKKAPDAIEIDTTQLSISEVIDTMLKTIKIGKVISCG